MPEQKDVADGTTEGDGTIEIEFVDDDHDGGGSAVSAAAEGPTDKGPDEQEVQRLTSEIERLREMYLRKLAEFDNFRKRTDREREELRRIAAEILVKEMLPVIDNFERALQHAGNSDPETFREGVEMISRQLWDLLQREGLQAVDPSGEAFDPELHEAVQRVEDADEAPGTVTAVYSKGYTYGGRLLRPAMVAVAVEAPSASASDKPGSDGDDRRGGAS